MQEFDLCIIGTGSGNSIIDDRFAGQRIAIIEEGTFGGTCINVGCIPTKMLVHPADLALTPPHAARLGVDLELRAVHWPEIRDRIFGRIDPISVAGADYRRSADNITLFTEHARFVGPKQLELADSGTITADQFVIAAGALPVIPPVPGLDTVPFHTSDTVMRLDRLPKSMLIMGGGYVAAEFAHVFSAYGVAVTVVIRSDQMLRGEDADISARFTELLSGQVDLRRSTKITSISRDAAGVVAELSDGSSVEAEIVLIATGRTPNGGRLEVGATGVQLDDDGFVVVDDHQQTAVPGIFALGDVSSHHQLKHVANHEARIVQHNLLHPTEMITSDHRFVPHAVFSSPQVAAVGLTERAARDAGLSIRIGRQDYADVAYGWAMEDRDHFAKVILDDTSGQVVGAHLIGPEASSLIQPLITAMSFGIRAEEFARGQYWIHPALPELVENAVLKALADQPEQ